MRLPFVSVGVARRGRASCVALVLTVLAGACSGPRAPLNIGAKPVPLDMVLGVRKAVAGAPVPPMGFTAGPSGMPIFNFGNPHPSFPGRTRPPITIPRDCLTAATSNRNPSTVAPDRALLLAPGKHAYTYRAAGTFKKGGPDASEEAFPDTASVEIVDATSDLLTFQTTWKAAVTVGDDTTTTSYRTRNPGLAQYAADRELQKTPVGGLTITLVEEPAAQEPPRADVDYPEGEDPLSSSALRGRVTVPPNPAGDADPNTFDVAKPTRGVHNGLYIERIETAGAVAFQPPAPGLLLARFPLQVGTVFDVAASDGVTSMSYRTTVKPKAVVHACGFPLDTWTIELTRGKVVKVDTGEVVDFTARYQVATQFGGIVVDDYTTVEGSQGTTRGVFPVMRTLATTATTVPLSITAPGPTLGPSVTTP